MIYVHSNNGNFPWDGNREIPPGREILESQEFVRNSHMGNSREGKVRSHTGGSKWEFPIEHPWTKLVHLDADVQTYLAALMIGTLKHQKETLKIPDSVNYEIILDTEW